MNSLNPQLCFPPLWPLLIHWHFAGMEIIRMSRIGYVIACSEQSNVWCGATTQCAFSCYFLSFSYVWIAVFLYFCLFFPSGVGSGGFSFLYSFTLQTALTFTKVNEEIFLVRHVKRAKSKKTAPSLLNAAWPFGSFLRHICTWNNQS